MNGLGLDIGNQMMINNANIAINKSNENATNIKNSSDSKEMAKMKETAQDFEAFFLSQMMENMFSGISTDGMFGGGDAEKIYRSMLISEYGNNIAQNGGVGVADQVLKTMLEMQEQTSNKQLGEI